MMQSQMHTTHHHVLMAKSGILFLRTIHHKTNNRQVELPHPHYPSSAYKRKWDSNQCPSCRQAHQTSLPDSPSLAFRYSHCHNAATRICCICILPNWLLMAIPISTSWLLLPIPTLFAFLLCLPPPQFNPIAITDHHPKFPPNSKQLL